MNWEQIRSSSFDEIVEWASEQDWARQMKECQQDAKWHAEGDVWTHTLMVCEQLRLLPDWDLISDLEQLTLLFVALFHDVAKPFTTVVDPITGHVRSPKHAVKGEYVARNCLREMQCDFETRESICRLVRFHGRPVFLLEKDDPSIEIIRMSWVVNNRLLYLFALADFRGRKTDSTDRSEENLEYWKLYAKDLCCYESPYEFANSNARFTFFQCNEPNRYYEPHTEFSCTVTMLSGLPGSGKDTWIQRNSDAPSISLDAIRRELKVDPQGDQGLVVQTATERCRELLRAKKSFVFNATNLLWQTRARWLNLFHDYGAKLEIVYVEPQLERILLQNRKRKEAAVPEKVIRNLATRIEPPTFWEAHEVQYVTD